MAESFSTYQNIFYDIKTNFVNAKQMYFKFEKPEHASMNQTNLNFMQPPFLS